MFKKSLSLTLIACMIMSLFVITPVSAGAPVELDGSTQVVFDQSFGGLSGANGAPGFTIETSSGSAWNYMDYFIIGDGGSRSVTSPVVDLTAADNWTFTTKLSHTYNSYYIYLAYANNAGYILANDRSTKTLSLYKDTVTTALASVSIDVYNTDTTITVTYNKASNKLTVTNSKNSNVIEYTPEDTTDVPNLNGYFKVQGNSAGVFTVFNMYLEKFSDKITIDQWKYDKTFSAANTQAELEADGFTFSATTTPGASGLYYAGKTFYFGPNGKNISGDYYFETNISRSYNTYYFDFNRTADNGYYRIWYGVNDSNATKNKPWIKLQKYDASESKTHDLVVVDRASGLSSGHTRTYKGTVKTLEDGSVDINIEIYNGTTLDATLTYTDTDTDTVEVTTTTETTTTELVYDEDGNPVYEDDGVTQKTEEVTTTETTTENVDTGKPLTSGKLRIISNSSGSNSYVKYLKAYSIMSEDEQEEPIRIETTETLIDETFNNEDTVASLKEKGITFQTTPTLSADYLATDKFMYYSNDALADKYTISFSAHRNYNKSEIYFNYVDSNNYYFLDFGHGDRCFKLKKKVNGGDVIVLDEYVSTTASSYRYGYMGWTDYTIEVVPNDAKTELYIKITTKCTHDTKGAQTALPALEYTDTLTDTINVTTTTTNDAGEEVSTTTAVDTGAPIFDGSFRQKHASAGRLGYFKIEHTKVTYDDAGLATNGEVPVHVGRFSNDTGAINAITKDAIYFEYPTTMLGSYKVVAALYEDYKMTDSKVIEPVDLYTGKVKLFDTTNSTAEDIKIRVYFLENGENLKLVADEIYELK